MPASGSGETLASPEIDAVTEYVLKLSNKKFEPKQIATGQQVFADNCASCHGENGTGSRELGAPNLADALSLYGATRPTIRAQVYKPRHGVMPAWLKRLGKAQVKQLALYVHSLGGGEAEKTKE